MAALTSSNIVIVRSWTEGSVNGKERQCRLVRATFTAAGAASTDLLATLLSLTEVEEVSSLALDSGGNATALMTPTYDRSAIVVANWTTGILTNITGTFQFVVKGR